MVTGRHENSETSAEDDGILACDVATRPRGAPSFFDIQPSIRGMERGLDRLMLDFDPAAAALVEELVRAERLCCPHIDFALSHHPVPRLTIRTSPAQLDIDEQFLRV